MICSSCGRGLNQASVSFPCPKCGRLTTRCGHCRKLTVKYKCECGFEGP